MASCRIVARATMARSLQPLAARCANSYRSTGQQRSQHTTHPVSRHRPNSGIPVKTLHDHSQAKSCSCHLVGRQPGFRGLYTSSALGLLEDLESSADHTSLLMLIGQNRAKLNEDHVSRALIQLWEIMKFTADRQTVLQTEIHPSKDFMSLCVLAENKVNHIKVDDIVDVFYASIKLLEPDHTHSLIRELRSCVLSSLDLMSCKQLSKVAVCLADLGEGRTSALGAVTHAFGQKLDSAEDIREVSAWMRECLPLASSSLCSRTFAKVIQLFDGLTSDDMGKNDLRRVVQTAVKVRGAPPALIERCAKVFLHKMEQDEIPVREVCSVYGLISEGLNYHGENIQSRVNSFVRGKLPGISDGVEVSLAIELLAGRADADTKFLLEDKASELINRVPMHALHHLCHGLRLMNYVRMTPLTRKIIEKVKFSDCQNMQTDAIARILEYLIKVEGVDEALYKNMQQSLVYMLREAINPWRIVHITYCLSLLPLKSMDITVFQRAGNILANLHTVGVNQLLSSTVRIVRKLEKEGPLPPSCNNMLQDLQERAISSINKITSILYLNNIVDLLLEEGDQSFLVGIAMQRYSHILHKLTPQLAVDCARHVQRAKYLQMPLLDEIARVIAQNVNKITPLQVAYVLSPFSLLGYQPPNAGELFDACIGRIETFLDSLPAGYVVDVANLCALSQRYPEKILKKIFSLEFLTRLDEELEAIPNRSMMYRRKLMHLNRSLALECPEMQVPWFHEDFCQDNLKTSKVLLHTSLKEMQSTLVNVLGGPQFLRSFVVTPYHYDVSFECLVDAAGSPLPCADYGSVLNRLGGMAGGVLADLMQWGTQTRHIPEGAQRVAVDYLFSGAYCTNSRHAMGFISAKKRHLEVMGYKYVEIPYYEWHSMQQAETEDRVHYLQHRIYQALDLPTPVGSESHDTLGPAAAMALDGLGGGTADGEGVGVGMGVGVGEMSGEEDFVEDPLVMKVLQTFDRIGGGRRT